MVLSVDLIPGNISYYLFKNSSKRFEIEKFYNFFIKEKFIYSTKSVWSGKLALCSRISFAYHEKKFVKKYEENDAIVLFEMLNTWGSKDLESMVNKENQ